MTKTFKLISLIVLIFIAFPVSRIYALDVNIGGNVDYEDPVVDITQPPDGSTVSGITTVSATASDDSSITKVEFYIDSILINTDTTSPYSFSWDTTTVSNGSHKLKAIAYDAAGKSASDEFVVIVDNLVLSGPTKRITSPTIEPSLGTPSSGSGNRTSLLLREDPGKQIASFLADQKDFVLGLVVGFEIFLIFLLIYLLRKRKHLSND